jgi:hypothetical protein
MTVFELLNGGTPFWGGFEDGVGATGATDSGLETALPSAFAGGGACTAAGGGGAIEGFFAGPAWVRGASSGARFTK